MDAYKAINQIKAPVALAVILVGGVGWWLTDSPMRGDDTNVNLATKASGIQTDVERAEHMFNESGVPVLRISDVGDVHHPAWTALYALQYAGLETYDSRKPVPHDLKRFRACVDWLATNLTQEANGYWVWEYSFDNTYNDVTIKAPWASAFGQAVGIEALLASFRINGKKEHLALAEKAAAILFRPIEQGGLLYQRGNDIWFEEIPVPRTNPTHILNGHMRALLAIKSLGEATGRAEYHAWLKRGLDTLVRWLPLFDNGYWLRYDLNPRKSELLFRFNNPSGYALAALAVDSIILRDPLSVKEVLLDVGGPDDTSGEERIAGTDWNRPARIDGRTARRLKPVKPAAREGPGEQFRAPATYFYLSLPSRWRDNLRSERLELLISYKDEFAGNLSVQMMGIAPGPPFRDLRDGELLLSGSGLWRQQVIALHPSDLGWWVGQHYAEKHALYLEGLAQEAPALKQWVAVSKRYANEVRPRHDRNRAEGRQEQKKQVFLAADDPRNPLRIMRVPITRAMIDIAESILTSEENLTPHQKIVRFMNFMNDFKVGISRSGVPEEIIKARVGACGEFTNVLLALAATQGIEGRYVNLHNYPPGNGHTVAEFFIHGKWRLYDPSYSSYFTDTPHDERLPNVLSFEELRSGKGRRPGVTVLVGNTRRLEEYKPLSLDFVGPEIYELAQPAGPLLENEPFIYPLSIDFRTQPVLKQEHFGPHYQGVDYIGARQICRMHRWSFSSLMPGRLYEFQIVPERITREMPNDTRPFTLTSHMPAGGEVIAGKTVTYATGRRALAPWHIQFMANSPRVSMLIQHSLCGPKYYYLKIKQFRLREISVS